MHGGQSLIEESLWHGKHGGEKEGIFYSHKAKYYREAIDYFCLRKSRRQKVCIRLRVSSEQSERVANKIKMENRLYIPFLA
jgi:hypothetical protein